MGSGDNKVLVLADDFTGANDAGVSLAETGMRAEVAFTASYQGEAQALILNSDSRAQPAAEAARRITHLLQAVLPRFQPRWTVKKNRLHAAWQSRRRAGSNDARAELRRSGSGARLSGSRPGDAPGPVLCARRAGE